MKSELKRKEARSRDRIVIIEELRINDTKVSSSNLRTSFFQQWENDTGVSKCSTLIWEYLITWWLYIHFERFLVNCQAN